MSTQAYDIVKLARSNKRPTGLDYIQNLCGDFLELHGPVLCRRCRHCGGRGPLPGDSGDLRGH